MGRIVWKTLQSRGICRTLVAILMIQGAAIAEAVVIGTDEAARLGAGEALVTVASVDGADGAVNAVIDVPVPPSRAWQVLLECERAPQFMPNLKACSVIQTGPTDSSGGPKWDEREHRVAWIALLPDLRSRFHSDYVFEKEIRFRKTTGDLDVLDGMWSLDPIDGGRATRLRYNARIGFSAMVPGFMVRSSLESDFPQFLQALKAEMIRTDR